MATVMWNEFNNALVAIARAMPGYCAPTDAALKSTSRPVFDGPEYGLDGDYSGAWLCIGWSGDPEQAEDSGGSEQSLATMGNRGRAESGTIECMAVAQSGDVDSGATRALAFAVMSDFEDALRGNPTVSLSQSSAIIAEMSGVRVRQFMESGAVCRLAFTIKYRARI